MDLRKRVALMSHTWSSISSLHAQELQVFHDGSEKYFYENANLEAQSESEEDKDSKDIAMAAGDVVSDTDSTGINSVDSSSSIDEDCSEYPSEIPLKVMTFNLWHNNPASWVYGME